MQVGAWGTMKLASEEGLADTGREEKLAALGIRLGRLLSECGAETFRIEETVQRFLETSGMEEVEIFAVPTFLVISFTTKAKRSFTRSARLKGKDQDLDRLDALNRLARAYGRGELDLSSFETALNEIVAFRAYRDWHQYLAGGIGGAAFAMMLGTTLWPALLAIPATLVMYLGVLPLKKQQINSIFINLIGSALIMTMSLLFKRLGFLDASQMHSVSIGALMNLVPGLIMTNGIRDIIASDYVAGLSHLSEALMRGASLALGSGAILALEQLL